MYRCYLVPQYTYLSYVELLSGGRYEAGYTPGEPRTNGSYVYSAASNQVVWSGGDYEETWPVAYWVQPNVYPDGSKREGTGAARHTIALKVDHSNPRLPGQEVGSNPIYVYCYQEAG
ncbi:MAG: hypothetical protein FIA92_14390 [Chloroflexi bacterium]|nr:hypothetical protein [Chloroflexota bacterium]